MLQHESVDVIIQWVRTWWTKESRGGPAAAVRNAVPAGFTLPPTASPFVHEVTVRESEGFQPHFDTRTGLSTTAAEAGMFLKLERSGRLKVQLIPAAFGIPHRRRRPPAVRLEQGEWLRWQINYRFVRLSGGAWTYRLDTLNIVNGPSPTTVFTGTPSRHVDERAALR